MDERRALTHEFKIENKEVWLTVGEYEDGTLGEIFIRVDKEGGELRSYDGWAIACSLLLQHGIPDALETIINKFKHIHMEPSGLTNNPEIPFAKSIFDYVAKWLELRYLLADNLDKRPDPPS